LKAADAVSSSHSQDPKILFNLALLLAQNAQYGKTAELFSEVNRLRPGTAEVLYNLGVAEYNLKHLDPPVLWLKLLI
jgi:tetratricopeptide (TPR) repeat protein